MAFYQQNLSSAFRATDFLNSLGINTHMAQGEDINATIRALNYTGFRNVRDGGEWDTAFARNMLTVVHNYVCGNQNKYSDNVAWSGASSGPDCTADGIYNQYGRTWLKKFIGYDSAILASLPKVSTETGWPSDEFEKYGYHTSDYCKRNNINITDITQEQQARLFLNLYLSFFRRGYTYTFIYMLRETPEEPGFGFFYSDYTPKKAAIYFHNFTTILEDEGSVSTPGKVNYYIKDQPATVHDLLLQKSDGRFSLCIWNERAGGSDIVTVDLGSSFKTVSIYDPVTGTSPVTVSNNASSVTLALSDHPNIIEFTAK